MKATLRKKYAGLSRQQLLDKAHELGFNFEKCSHSCSQSTVKVLHEMFEIDDVVVRVATSSAGGQAGRVIGTCGALIGGTIVLDYFFGRNPEDLSCIDPGQANLTPLYNAIGVAGILFDKFVQEYGTIICPHIQTQLYGRQFFMADEQEMAKFEQAVANGKPERSCLYLVGVVSRNVMEILLDQGIISV